MICSGCWGSTGIGGVVNKLLQTVIKFSYRFSAYTAMEINFTNLTYKTNNYHQFYGKTFIVTTAIISDNRELQGYAVFYPRSISSFS